MPPHLYTARGCFHTTTAQLSSRNRDHVAGEARNIYYLALYRKSLLTPMYSDTLFLCLWKLRPRGEKRLALVHSWHSWD